MRIMMMLHLVSRILAGPGMRELLGKLSAHVLGEEDFLQ